MNGLISFGKTVFCIFILLLSFQCLKAQEIDTVKSDYVYDLLTSSNFNKTIIDGRDSVMFYSGHIKNAVYIDAFQANLNKSLEKYLTEDTLIVYCTNNRRSLTIIEHLITLNYQGLIIYMQDGLNAWKENEFDIVINEVESLIQESENYLENRDFDGDSISDYLSFSYTGGAHCCYKMSIKLSSQKDTIKYPFEMDGGYGFGIVDGSQHDHFSIDDFDQDGLAEIFIEIATYNGEKYAIEKEWTDDYGITTNYIVFDYQDGEIVIMDYDKEKHNIKKK